MSRFYSVMRFILILAGLLIPCSHVFSDEAFGPGTSESASPRAWYGEGVRPTGPLAPEEELAGFHVPPGFSVELVAAEPAIDKPLNMAFDGRGRLWVSNTLEYPNPAPVDRKPRDSIRILEDVDRDGHFEKVTTFADELNIPIGVLPISDGAIAFSIPNLIHLRDIDGDGVCDERKILLGPFDTTRDTHGMINSLRMGIDGWVYACHGFSNQSKVTATDGSTVTLDSGNTFRFRVDGSRIEHVSFGQVNPFGMTTDPWGNWFTADCHSKPITQLLRGGYFTSFGRSHDGLGFVPSMMEHSHGSTAICGLEIYDAEAFPAGYRNQFYSGNVMTSRINRNAIEEHGATLRAKELPDFLTSDDPWFRPVDIQLGPDGGLYVADFYNKIIGHYEVPLTHPERDRDRGRIWRIVYRGEDAAQVAPPDSSIVDSESGDFDLLAHANTTVRRLARERIRLRDDSKVVDALKKGLRHVNPQVRIECGWELARRAKLNNRQRIQWLRDQDSMVRAQAVRAIAEQSDWSDEVRAAVRLCLLDSDPRVVRFAAEAIGRMAEATDVLELLKRLEAVPAEDTILRQAIRIAVRDALSDDHVAAALDVAKYLQSSNPAKELADILLGLQNSMAASWLLSYLANDVHTLDSILKTISHVAAWISDEEFLEFIELLKHRTTDFRLEQRFFLLVHSTMGKRSEAAKKSLTAWGETVSATWYQQFLESLADQKSPSVGWSSGDEESWPGQKRAAKDGVDDSLYLSSFPRGEKYQGTLRSDSFSAPERLSFWLVGHNGNPKEPDSRKNCVRLIDDATQTILREAFPPRSDIAKRIEWDLADWKDRTVHIECLDRDDGKAYAWIGIGRFDFPPLQSNELQQTLQDGLKLIRVACPTSIADSLLALAKRDQLDARSRCEIIEAWATVREKDQLSQLALVVQSSRISTDTLQFLLDATVDASAKKIGAEVIKTISANRSLLEQRTLAKLLARKRASMPWLVLGLKEGWLSTEVLRDSLVIQAIESLSEPADNESIRMMLSSLPSTDTKVEELLKRIESKVGSKLADPVRGAIVFQKHCSNCHQLAGAGAIVGPQLDGAIARNSGRLLEDILFPDRNVDHAFQITMVQTDDGLVRVGLLRNETADFVELVENNGQTSRIEVDAIAERKLSQRSLMPSGLQDSIGEEGLIDLLAFLLSKRDPAITKR